MTCRKRFSKNITNFYRNCWSRFRIKTFIFWFATTMFAPLHFVCPYPFREAGLQMITTTTKHGRGGPSYKRRFVYMVTYRLALASYVALLYSDLPRELPTREPNNVQERPKSRMSASRMREDSNQRSSLLPLLC